MSTFSASQIICNSSYVETTADIGNVLQASDEFVTTFASVQQQNCIDGVDRPTTCRLDDTPSMHLQHPESFAPLTKDPWLDEYKACNQKIFKG